jgi:outer membrane immunogenic protein
MRLIQSAAASLLALMAVAAPALAADAPVKAPARAAAVAPMFNWTGWYGGLHAGYGWGKTSVSPLNGGERDDSDGWVGGAQIGYNWQSGSWVWGVELDGAFANIENSAGFGPPPEGYVKIKNLVTARLRTGPTMGNTFYYVTGGYANGGVKYIDFDVGPAARSKRHSGFAVGLGVEHAFAPNWTARLEYLYVDLGHKVYPQGTDDTVDVTTNIVRVALNYRFASGKYPIGKTAPAPVVTKY